MRLCSIDLSGAGLVVAAVDELWHTLPMVSLSLRPFDSRLESHGLSISWAYRRSRVLYSVQEQKRDPPRSG